MRDATHLRVGSRWEPGIQTFIEQADVFQLFWSRSSALSKHVESEWRQALQERRKRPDPFFIRPVYWTDDVDPEPPHELQELQFARLPP